MFDVAKIQTELSGLIGIRQPANPVYQKIDATNLLSRSGLYVDDVPQFKTEFFIDNTDYKDISNVDLNNEIRRIINSSTVSVCNQIFNKPSFTDRNYLYSNANTRQDLETTLKNGFVGYEIEPSKTKDVAFKITDVRIELSGLTGNLDLYLFSSSEILPIETKTLLIDSKSKVVRLDWVVNNTAGYKGKYYFGYVYNGSYIPFKRNYEDSDVMNCLSELSIQKMLKEGADASEMFDLDNLDYISENIGLNPDITVYDDYTDLIIQNQHLLAEAIQMQTAITMMQGYAVSLRSNRNERISKDALFMTLQQIEGSHKDSAVKVTGLNHLLSYEIKRIRKVINELTKGYFGSGVQTQTLS